MNSDQINNIILAVLYLIGLVVYSMYLTVVFISSYKDFPVAIDRGGGCYEDGDAMQIARYRFTTITQLSRLQPFRSVNLF